MSAELERALLEVEVASRSKTTFLANMSHEIRTPLNAIIGWSHLLHEEIGDPQHQKQLQKISDSAQHLLALMNDILDVSKIEGGRLALEEVEFELDRTLDRVRGIIAPRALARGLEFDFQIDQDLDRSLKGDPLKLQQVLLNLLGNAIKFTELGKVTLRMKLSEVSEEQVLIHFAIEDTGIGIDADTQARIFQTFEQADGSTTRRYGGIGLGLPICEHLVQLMGGEIGLSSEVGQGSTFWFTARLGCTQRSLSKTAKTPEVATYQPSPFELQLRRQQRGAKILLVEDNPVNQEVVAFLLHEVGLQVELAKDGVEAVEMVSAGPFDFILMDMQMPRMDGIEATLIIRALRGWEKIPIVALTAHTHEEDRQRCLDAGMNDHLSKPIDPVALYRCLSQLLAPRPLDTPDRKAPASPLAAGSGEISERLAAIVGLDSSRGLRNLHGKLPNYIALLRRFAQQHALDAVQIQRLAKSDVAAAQRSIHALKGAAGALGATGLESLLGQLQTALRDPAGGDEVALLLEALEEHQQILTGAILGLPAATAEGAIDIKTIRVELVRLATYLAEDDIKAASLAIELAPQLEAALGEEGHRLALLVSNFEYQQALVLVRGLFDSSAAFREK